MSAECKLKTNLIKFYFYFFLSEYKYCEKKYCTAKRVDVKIETKRVVKTLHTKNANF